MEATELSRELRRRAEEAGFHALAVAQAGRLDRDAVAFDDWLRAGRHASMTWLERHGDRRADPRALLPGCSSVITVAMSYWPGEGPAATSPDRADVALYARGRDYHKILGKRLKALAAWLADASGVPARAFVDTGPVLERGWAQRSGLGWIGKNANLLRRDAGSWLLLGEILAVAELEPDAGPHADHCGTCTACIDACPTDAIVADGVVDSNLCISYWNIEHRGPIPEPRRAGVGNWIFGCDVCQDVCPWSRKFATEPPGDPFEWREDLRGLDAAEILALDEAGFRERYSGTPLMRARWDGMRRNACVVLGNRRDPEALGVLETALRDPSALIRSHAAWACGRIGGARARELLRAAAAKEADPEVIDELSSALALAGEVSGGDP